MSGCAKGGYVGEYERVMATETRPVDPGDPYVDPPRNWKRVGLIAAAWAVLWVVVGAIGWFTMQIPALTPDDRPKGANDNQGVTVFSFLQQTYINRDAAAANALVCEGAPIDSATYISEVESLAAQRGEPVPVSWEDLDDVQPGVVSVRVSYKLAIPSEVWTVSLTDNGGWCIASIVENPAPTPS